MLSRFAVWFALLSVAGCGDPAPVLGIVANQRPVAGTCELSQRDTRDSIARGTFDLAIGDRSSYILTPLVRNPEGAAVTMEHAHITLQWEQSGELVPLSLESEAGVVYSEWDLDLDACATECPSVPARGTASFEVPVLPRVVTQYLGHGMVDAVMMGRVPPEYRLVSTVTLVGTSRGAPVEAEPFDYEIRFCLGCLVTFPDGTDSPTVDGPDCCGGGAPAPTCQAGQDDPIDCRSCLVSLPEICNFGRLSCGR